MENSYRFYANTACQYRPCHKTDDLENFNCMFCYCPLYFLDDCGGNHKNNNGIKDCSDCLLPHRPDGYDYINKKIAELNQKKALDYYIANQKK